jgi:hypothetical protein
MESMMDYTFTVTVSREVLIGRNGSHGAVYVDWDRVPQNVLDHIAGVYFPQYITDAANSKGTDSPSEERLSLAQKKIEQMYAGEIRTRGSSGEPVDPLENRAYQLAKQAVGALVRSAPEAKTIDKALKGDEKLLAILQVRSIGRGEDAMESLPDYIGKVVDSNPTFRAEAKRALAAEAKAKATELTIAI